MEPYLKNNKQQPWKPEKTNMADLGMKKEFLFGMDESVGRFHAPFLVHSSIKGLMHG